MSRSGSQDPFAMLDVRTREASSSDSASPTTSGISSVPGSGSSTPPVRREEERRHQLRKMKRRATGMLVVMTIFFLVITVLTDGTGVWGYLQAMAGRGLRMLPGANRPRGLCAATRRGLERLLAESRETLRLRFAEEAPWWRPEAVDDRIFERLFAGVCRLLRDVNRDPNHEVRK